MNSLRAPEFATSALKDILDKLTAGGAAELVKTTCVSLPVAEWTLRAKDVPISHWGCVYGPPAAATLNFVLQPLALWLPLWLWSH